LDKLLAPSGHDQRTKVYEILNKFYPMIKNIYRHVSSLAPAGGLIPCIGTNTLAEMIFNSPGLLDRKNLNLSKVDLHFVSTNATKV
jgi:hypothetical protein